MAKKALSVAPKERINIKFVPATGDQQEEIELPMKTIVLGDFTGRADDTALEERRATSIDKNSFAKVMKEMDLERVLEVKDVLSDDPDGTLNVKLQFEKLKDFEPDAVVEQVPELKKLKDLRDALTALKGPLGNLPSFRRALSDIVDDESKRDALLSELGGLLEPEGADAQSAAPKKKAAKDSAEAASADQS